ncbi:MAG: TIGR00730 family Rossman fold protein [Bacteroidales bacterium]|nr:TIGR00730 family Rossman fold protein [Bacteroidales bacterium]
MHISVFCGSSMPHNSEITMEARKLGRRIAEKGHTLLYGGSNLGLMGEVSGAALQAGGRVVAVIPTIFCEEIILSQPVSELIRVRSMAERKEYLIAHSDAFIALPGGIGTLDEVLEVLVAKQLGQTSDRNATGMPMVLYNPNGFYDTFLQQIEIMGREGFFRSGKAPELIAEADMDKLLESIGC